MSWTLLRSPSDWGKYMEAMADEMGIATSHVSWGSGPPMYPVLVASLRSSANKVSTCYVTPSDAADLIRAAGYEPVAVDEVSQHEQASVGSNEFHKHTAAMMMAIVNELIEVGVTTPERFEQLHNAKLSSVDRWHAEDIEDFTDGDTLVCDQLLKTSEDDEEHDGE